MKGEMQEIEQDGVGAGATYMMGSIIGTKHGRLARKALWGTPRRSEREKAAKEKQDGYKQ